MVPAECRKFERKMAGVEKNAQQGENFFNLVMKIEEYVQAFIIALF